MLPFLKHNVEAHYVLDREIGLLGTTYQWEDVS